MDCNDKLLMFSRFTLVSWKNCQKLTMVCSSFKKIIQFLFLDILGVFCAQEKTFNLNLRTFFTPKCKNPRDSVPLNYNDATELEMIPHI